MKKYNFVFVILHYITIDDTLKCVNSILEKYSTSNVKIVIVDNGSPNNSYEQLNNLYSNNERVKLVFSPSNLGFAKGNNLGFDYAKKVLNADFIIMINNDTCLIQDDFLERIVDEYEYSSFSVLGPKILLKNGKTNDIYFKLQSIEHYKKDLRIMKYEYLLNQIYLYPIYIYFRKNIRKLFIKLKLKKENVKKDVNVRYENIVLHGCALIFSPKYIELFDGIDDRTFLYREEELLYVRLKKNNLKNVYNPLIQIYHNEDGSTDALTKSKRKKRLFVGKNLIKSTKLLIKELEEIK